MHKCGVIAVVTIMGAVGTAAADPTARFGLTSGVNRQTREGVEFGPMIAVGGTAGRFVGEASYSYLSFVDPETATHRLGVAVRADLIDWQSARVHKTLYAEVGAAHRWGTWRVGDDMDAVERTQNEMHVGLGYQLDDKWQLGVRFGLARPDGNQTETCPANVACRQISMDSPADLVGSVMLEWMFLLGR